MVKTYSNSTQGNTVLSPHFKVKEFACKDGSDTVLIDDNLVAMLEKLYTALNCSKIIINSGYRTVAYNAQLGGASSSQHCKGTAADIVCYDQSGQIIDAKLVCCTAQDLGFGGIGYISATATHVDVRTSNIYRGDERSGYSNNVPNGDFYAYFGISKPAVTAAAPESESAQSAVGAADSESTPSGTQTQPVSVTRKGVDVSTFQGKIDWGKVKAAGIEFAMLRAGYGKVSTQKDAQFENNYNGCKANGMPCGAYWYSYATNASDAQLEANTFLGVINGKTFEYPVVLDIEESCCQTNATEICQTFCSVLENAGYFVTIYASKAFLESYISSDVREKYDIWVAQWASKCTYSGSYGMWQYSGDSQGARVNGINGVVDLDYAYKDYPNIIKNAGLNGNTPDASGTDQPAVAADSTAVTDPELPAEPAQPANPTESANPYPVPAQNLKSGSSGDDVKWVQTQLNAFGYNLNVDGIFGPATNAAVRSFQQNNGLSVDGIVGVNTTAKLEGASPAAADSTAVTDTEPPAEPAQSANPYSVPAQNLKSGSRGDDVKWVQTQLNSFGYNLNVDGIFGPATDAAVRSFQQNNGLSVDGIVGVNTRAKLLA
ncbi:MAG: peptidoglycan-binding protein [Oscillospiraceae bacterium]|jgi:peptidoglycan hydrolase-like protein with peptidoglycan-binding domain|nr:peptidoglycan-binding protein [Oscillospiraceae bacterium]